MMVTKGRRRRRKRPVGREKEVCRGRKTVVQGNDSQKGSQLFVRLLFVLARTLWSTVTSWAIFKKINLVLWVQREKCEQVR